MKKVLNFLKAAYAASKNWLALNGVDGILGLILGLTLWVIGYKVYAGFAFGVFATRNWDIVVDWLDRK